LLTNLTRDALLPSLGAGLIFAPLVASVIGFGAWRATFAVLVRGERLPDAWRVGLGLGLGAILGRALALDQASFDVLDLFTDDQITQLGLEGMWSLLLLASLVVFLAWITACASTWLEVAMTRRSPRPVAIGGAAVAGSMLAVWLGLLFATHETFLAVLAIGGATIPALAGIAIYLLMQPLVPFALICLWAFPLAAWFWRRRSVSPSAPGWAFLDPASPSLILLPQAPLRPRLALWAGVIGSIPFVGLLLLAWIIRRWGISEAMRGTDQAILIFYYGQILIAGLFQAIIAAVVAGLVRRLGALHGLFAAFVAGCLMTIAILGLNLAFGGTIDLGFAGQTYAFVVNGGALLALPLALAVAALAGWVRRVRRASGSQRTANAALLQQLLAETPAKPAMPAYARHR